MRLPSIPLFNRLDPKTRRILLRVALLSSLILLAAFVWVTFFIPPSLPTAIVTAKRNSSGTFVENIPEPLPLGYSLTSDLTASITNGPPELGGATFDRLMLCKSVAIFPQSADILDIRTSYSIYQRLKKLSFLDEITWYPPGLTPLPGAPVPDLIIDVRSRDVVWKSSFLKQSVSGDMEISASLHAARSPFSPGFVPAAPVLASATVQKRNFTQEISGIISSANHAKSLADKIADNYTADLAKSLQTQLAANPPPTSLPPEFLPAFTPTPNLPFLSALGARPLFSGPAFMASNISLWRIDSLPEKAILRDAAAHLKSLDWFVSDYNLNSKNSADISFIAISRDETQRVEFFWVHDSQGVTGKSLFPPYGVATYTHTMIEPQISAAMAAFLQRKPTEKELLPYASYWSMHPDLLESIFTATPPITPQGVAWAAVRQRKQLDTPATRLALAKAHAVIAFSRITLRNGYRDLDNLKAAVKAADLPPLPNVPDFSLLPASMAVQSPTSLPHTAILALEQTIYLVQTPTPTGTVIGFAVTPRRNRNLLSKSTFDLMVSYFTFRPDGSYQLAVEHSVGDPTSYSGSIPATITQGASPIAITSTLLPGANTYEVQFK
jgi:hypothetical protein